MLFSQRQGITPSKKAIQKDSMDDDLRIRIWNAFYEYYLLRFKGDFEFPIIENTSSIEFLKSLIRDYFKDHIETFSYTWEDNCKRIKKYFFRCKWFEVYNFIEYVATNFYSSYIDVNSKKINSEFIKKCNKILTKEFSAYRFVGGKIVKITSEAEIAEIDEALESTDNLKPVNDHLKKALDFLADRQSPDYNNSIKESISAVESICSLIAGIKKAKLRDALDKIKKEGKVKIHPALESAFDSLFGYTSDEGGIRHAKIKKSNVDFEEAKFMLVSCSAFINYLLLKCEKAGIKL